MESRLESHLPPPRRARRLAGWSLTASIVVALAACSSAPGARR